MKELTGNLWDHYITNGWLIITTNGDVNKQGKAVMGRGIARQAAYRFPQLPIDLGYYLKQQGNIPFKLDKYLMFTLPVKHHWFEEANINLIRISCLKLIEKLENYPAITSIYMPRPGCGNGKLQWTDVKPKIENILDDRFTVVEIR